MIRAITFDVGGVLIRTEDHTPRRRLEERLGLKMGEAEHIVYNSAAGLQAQLGEISAAQHWRQIQTRFGLSESGFAEFRRDFWGGDRLDMSLVAYVRRLRPRYRTAVISNAMDDLTDQLTAKYAIADAFDLIVGSAYEGIMKPDPAIYRRALSRLDCLPNEAVFIDDTLRNVDGARAVGLLAVHYTPGLDVPAALATLGVVAG
ncbi:MAG: HAD family phosphatase [Caldilineaceae bacterium]|nr:HAD family phosphatase [Caldilineaceae bacterium]